MSVPLPPPPPPPSPYSSSSPSASSSISCPMSSSSCKSFRSEDYPWFPPSMNFSSSQVTSFDGHYSYSFDPSGVDVPMDRSTGSAMNVSSSSSVSVARSDRCLVCHDRSSGIHFGVSTCEACKAFFRRTSLSSASISLPCSPTRCEINVKNRNNCPTCRFDKCKRLGMDRDNVIYGKPSKQHLAQCSRLNASREDLPHRFEEIFHVFEQIYRLSSTGDYPRFHHNQQHIARFEQLVSALFFFSSSSSTSATQSLHASTITDRIFVLLFNSDQTLSPHECLAESHLRSRLLLFLWLFVYCSQTSLCRDVPSPSSSSSPSARSILIQLLDLQWMTINRQHIDENTFRTDFLNTFTRFADLLDNLSSEH